MKVLVLGSGAREHALAWKFALSDKLQKVYLLPGNELVKNFEDNKKVEVIDNISLKDFESIKNFVKNQKIDLTFVGPEAPLVDGIVDEFKKDNLNILGPDKYASQLEGSKAFAKNFMKKYNIPTADFYIFDNYELAKKFLENYFDKNVFGNEKIENFKDIYKRGYIVIKASGLASGKGVLVTNSKKEALEFLEKIMVNKIFGKSGEVVVIEKCLDGIECSYFILADGENFVSFPTARDYKRAFDKDTGPNTGGMGGYSPNPIVDENLKEKILQKIVKPTLKGLKKEGHPYKGVLYLGLMITKNKEPYVLEYNVRFGDPECQILVRRVKEDFGDLFEKALKGNLPESIKESSKKALCIVLASEGYPFAPCEINLKDLEKKLKSLDKKDLEDIKIFFANKKGRILSVTSLGDTFKEAREKAYKVVNKIALENTFYRKDIGEDVEND